MLSERIEFRDEIIMILWHSSLTITLLEDLDEGAALCEIVVGRARRHCVELLMIRETVSICGCHFKLSNENVYNGF